MKYKVIIQYYASEAQDILIKAIKLKYKTIT
jgi:hypothetical protein